MATLLDLAAQMVRSGTYADFLTKVLAQAQQHIILIQDGAGYDISQALNDFFALPADRLPRVPIAILLAGLQSHS